MIVDRFLGDQMRVPARRFAETLAIDTAAFKASALKITLSHLLYIFIMMNAIYSVLSISSAQISCRETTYGFGMAL